MSAVAEPETSTERGFGTGLRAKLTGGAGDESPRSPGEAIAAATTPGELEVQHLRAELSASLAREQELRSSLHVDQAVDDVTSVEVEQRLAELDHRASQLSATESALEEREQQMSMRMNEVAEAEGRMRELQDELARTEARIAEREQLVEMKIR